MRMCMGDSARVQQLMLRRGELLLRRVGGVYTSNTYVSQSRLYTHSLTHPLTHQEDILEELDRLQDLRLSVACVSIYVRA